MLLHLETREPTSLLLVVVVIIVFVVRHHGESFLFYEEKMNSLFLLIPYTYLQGAV
jgi:hypothetical protein